MRGKICLRIQDSVKAELILEKQEPEKCSHVSCKCFKIPTAVWSRRTNSKIIVITDVSLLS